MAVLTDYKKDRLKRERERAISGLIIFLSIMVIFGAILFTVIKNKPENARQEKIYENLKSCPKSSVVDCRSGKPFVLYRGQKTDIEREGCK